MLAIDAVYTIRATSLIGGLYCAQSGVMDVQSKQVFLYKFMDGDLAGPHLYVAPNDRFVSSNVLGTEALAQLAVEEDQRSPPITWPASVEEAKNADTQLQARPIVEICLGLNVLYRGVVKKQCDVAVEEGLLNS